METPVNGLDRGVSNLINGPINLFPGLRAGRNVFYRDVRDFERPD